MRVTLEIKKKKRERATCASRLLQYASSGMGTDWKTREKKRERWEKDKELVLE